MTRIWRVTFESRSVEHRGVWDANSRQVCVVAPSARAAMEKANDQWGDADERPSAVRLEAEAD